MKYVFSLQHNFSNGFKESEKWHFEIKMPSQAEMQRGNVQSHNSSLSAKRTLIRYKIYLMPSFENISTNDKSVFCHVSNFILILF